MPSIEELPISAVLSTTSGYGYGYAIVPEPRTHLNTATSAPFSSGNASGIASGPGSGRKRASRYTGGIGGGGAGGGAGLTGDSTSRQAHVIARHLADLDRDSHRDVQIPIPSNSSKAKDGQGKGSGSKKTTANVRRILMSQKTFANHLADEEAALALQAQLPTQHSHHPTNKRSLETSNRQSTVNDNDPKGDSKDPNDSVDNGVNDNIELNKDPEDPLLKIYVPEIPSEDLMNQLISRPALSYNASRATLAPGNIKPQRHFCDICGYWGQIKCLRCGVRVCGLDCKITHDDGRCLKFYA